MIESKLGLVPKTNLDTFDRELRRSLGRGKVLEPFDLSADLPVKQLKFEFVINLKTAKEIDLTISPNVLARADRVIR